MKKNVEAALSRFSKQQMQEMFNKNIEEAGLYLDETKEGEFVPLSSDDFEKLNIDK